MATVISRNMQLAFSVKKKLRLDWIYMHFLLYIKRNGDELPRDKCVTAVLRVEM